MLKCNSLIEVDNFNEQIKIYNVQNEQLKKKKKSAYNKKIKTLPKADILFWEKINTISSIKQDLCQD